MGVPCSLCAIWLSPQIQRFSDLIGALFQKTLETQQPGSPTIGLGTFPVTSDTFFGSADAW
ncbi:hypothetical protein DPV78_005724 [Talaromyces pinophilus]|nr:hypothetical protein DPV78_005724 [Talaromyces pinophilus]